MSTRSTTHFLYEGDSKPTAIIYRHSDGYPSGAGADLLRFFDEVNKLRDKRFSDASYLAAKYVVFLAQEFATSYDSETRKWTPNESRLDFLSVGVMNEDPCDIEYRYVVHCEGQRPRVQCFHRTGDWDDPCWVEVDMIAERLAGCPKDVADALGCSESDAEKILSDAESAISKIMPKS